MIFGALEAGGTKMVCAIGDDDGRILEQESIPTTVPGETMSLIIEYFKRKGICALGVGCFGPVNLDRNSDTYGYITSTPKLSWKNYDIVGSLNRALKIPVGFDTDVNSSLLGEMTWGAAKGISNVIYMTVGTGIGVGVASNGKLLHGMMHPEAGHIMIPMRRDDHYSGNCPYHGTCLEGLASGPAIEGRWGSKAELLSDRDEVWELEAYYIAVALINYIMILSPERIILGGGVMHQRQLFGLVQEKVLELLGGYIDTKQLRDLEHYIVPAFLGDDQGILGALKLGMDEWSLETGMILGLN